MSDEVLGDRRKALEESFFARENAKLLEKMRAEKSADTARDALAKLSGIENDEMLDKLRAMGIEADTWAAVSIAPLIEVAWADGNIADAERAAVLSAAEANGIATHSPGFALLENWLKHRPDGRLLEVWGEFIVGLCADLTATERDALKQQVIGRARNIAEAAGGFLGLGRKVSPEEEVILEQLSKAFEA
jgi:hypothetical protein